MKKEETRLRQLGPPKRGKYTDAVLDCFAGGLKPRYSELDEKLVGRGKAILHERQLTRELRHLRKHKLLKKENGRYTLNPHFRHEIARSTDSLVLKSYRTENIVVFPRSTFYGLKKNVFVPVPPEDPRSPLFTKESLYGVEARLTIEDIFGERRSVSFQDAVDKIVDKLLEIKKMHRLKILGKNYEKRLNGPRPKKTKIIKLLRKHNGIFLSVLNFCDWDKDKEKNIDDVKELVDNFADLIVKLNRMEKTFITNFLWGVLDDTRDLYPTDVAIVARSFSGAFIGELGKKYDEVRRGLTSAAMQKAKPPGR